MRLSADSINLGSVTSQSNNGITIEVGTNSPSWVIVTATSQHGGLKHKTDNVSINNTNSGTYAYASSANNPDLQNSTYLDTTHINTPSQLVQIYKSSWAEILNSSDDDISFTVTAQAQTSAPAGEYEDYITFTILASF
jgi:hypothetical protein